MARRSAVGQGLRYGSAYVDTTEICSLRYNCRSGPGAIRALRPKRAHLFRNQRSSPGARAIPIGRASLMAFGTILRSNCSNVAMVAGPAHAALEKSVGTGGKLHPGRRAKSSQSTRGSMLSSRMTTGLERVARALCELDANPPDATMGGKPLWRDYLPEASAAIMALREPDKAMMTAAKLEAVQTGRDDFGKIYRAMIDAAMIE